MKNIFPVLLMLFAHTAYAQDCITQAANKPSTSVRFQDVTDKPGDGSKVIINLSKINPNLNKAESWVKGILKNFTGAKLAYSNDYFFDYTSGFTKDFYNTTGIKGFYSAKMRFYAYYCYDNNNKIFTEDESGSFAAVIFNNVFASSLCTDVGVFMINGKYAFKIFEKSRTEGRIDFYEQLAKNNEEDKFPSKHDFIIIRNSDQPVFIPITRKEYLLQLLKNIDANREAQIAFAKSTYDPKNEAANKAEFDAALKRIDNSKTSTPEQMAPYRKRFIETWETEKQKFDKQITRIEKEITGAKQVLQEYMNKPAEWQNRTIKQFYSYDNYTEKGLTDYFNKLDIFEYSIKEESRTQIVYINPAYYNKSFTADVPQLIMVHLPKGNYPHMRKVSDLVKQSGALAPLEAILNPGKQTAPEIPTTVTSTYTLTYLPKLNQLTPLTVPTDMKPALVPVTGNNNNAVAAAKINFKIPLLSPKLKQLPSLPFTADDYKKYMQNLYTKISAAIKPEEKKKADDYVKNKKLTQSKDISNAAFAAWLQNTPKASLYLYSKAVAGNPSDALAANNFSAFLIMGGLPEKSIPILEYWNLQKPGKATILSNLGNAYYHSGDITNAMKYLLQTVQKDSLNPTANKILCIMYLKKGDVKKAEEHGTRAIATCMDEQVISILRQLNNKIKPGEIMSRFPPMPQKEFPMLQRIKLPVMPTSLDDMEQFTIELNALKESLKMTIAEIEAKTPKVNDDKIQQKILMAGLKNGISSIQLKAQYIIMDGMQTYQYEQIKEYDVFKYHLKKLNISSNAKSKAILKKYNDQLSKLEGGEAGDEDKIAALELAKCKELNAATQMYLAGLSQLVNQYATRQEYVSRKFFRDYANWEPYWIPDSRNSFPTIEREYLNDVLHILDEYVIVEKMNCSVFEPLPAKKGTLQKWEDEYCANFKGKIAFITGAITWTCNSWGIEGGEGIVGEAEVIYNDDGSFKEFILGGGLGESLSLDGGIAGVELGASIKEFIRIGLNSATGKWEVKDFGLKTELALEGNIGNVAGEIKLVELSVSANAGLETGGLAVPLFDFN